MLLINKLLKLSEDALAKHKHPCNQHDDRWQEPEREVSCPDVSPDLRVYSPTAVRNRFTAICLCYFLIPEPHAFYQPNDKAHHNSIQHLNDCQPEETVGDEWLHYFDE